MGSEYADAVDMFLPTYYSYSTNAHKAIVQHCTGGNMTVQSIYNTFLSSMRSAHFGIGLDGTVAQFVPLARGAGGNCCPDSTHNAYWNPLISQYGNLNLCTISIEHCNDSSQSLQMPPAQMEASNKLTLWLCQQYGLGPGDIWGHNSIDSTNCPGSVFYDTYWSQMMAYVKNGGGSMIPQGWSDDSTTLKSPNGVPVVMGFRDYILAHTWDAANWALGPEVGLTQLEASNPSLGGGTQQMFRYAMLGYTQAKGVFVEWLGVELNYTRNEYAALFGAYQKLLGSQPGNPQMLADIKTAAGLFAKYL